ncbi:MAG: hypothetical protein O3B24_11275 [Verrucomicrobia bacterium]|nr:hypothetical protein [Verrucomicrobiota bacterium]
MAYPAQQDLPPHITAQRTHRETRSGQAIIFIMLAMIILLFIVMWNFDLHKTFHVKSITQNGGDAAAMMGARWQGISLNLIGDLNIMQAFALTTGDTDSLLAISNLQARLSLVGPMIGFMAAQQAAKNNGVHQNDTFSAMIRDHARVVREEYARPVGPGGEMAFPEPYPDAWDEYADMLDLIADDGVAAGPENARFFTDYVGDHLLLNPDFYRAVAGRTWCWFYHNAPGHLQNYTDFTWWPELPPIEQTEYVNSEIFGLGLRRQATTAAELVPPELLASTASDRQLSGLLSPMGMATTATWYCYGSGWTPWLALARDVPNPFPATGTVRPQYDYAGADAAVRVVAQATRITPATRGAGNTNTITWTAAAKALGFLGEADPPHSFSLILPAFDNARLIALDASSAWSGGSFDPEWRYFIENDLPHYVATGELNCQSFYCEQLRTWEQEAFRQDGVDWLEQNSGQCTVSEGGGSHGGGTSRGH